MADSSNTGRNFLIIGALLGIAAAGAGVYVLNSAPTPDIDPTMGSGKQASLTDEAVQLKDDALAVRTVTDVAPKDAVIPRVSSKTGTEPRYTPIFFAPKLWQIHTQDKSDVRDLLNPKSERVHSTVDNTEFFKYGIEQVIGDDDALEQDQDGDGFTNGEEFAAGSNPADSASMPPFAGEDSVKMVVCGRKAEAHTLSLSSMFPYTGEIDISVFRGKGSGRETMRINQAKGLAEGATFGLTADAKSGPNAANRFKVVSTKGEDSVGKYIEIEDSYAKVPSQRVFKLRPGSKDDQMHAVDDITVNFRMIAGAEKDKELSSPIQLGETFDVPGFAGVTCTLVKATAKDIRVKVGDKEIKVQNEKKTAN